MEKEIKTLECASDLFLKMAKEQGLVIHEAPVTIQKAIEKLVEELKKDSEYYYSWQANIAMAFQDEFWSSIKNHSDLDLMDAETMHKIANEAAKNFLDQLTCKYCELAEAAGL